MESKGTESGVDREPVSEEDSSRADVISDTPKKYFLKVGK